MGQTQGGGRACSHRRRGCSGTAELPARGDAELGEDLVEVPFDGATADVQASRDLGVGESLADEANDLSLLRGELSAACGSTLADAFAGGLQLVSSALSERVHLHADEH